MPIRGMHDAQRKVALINRDGHSIYAFTCMHVAHVLGRRAAVRGRACMCVCAFAYILHMARWNDAQCAFAPPALQSPNATLAASRTYTYCLWARLGSVPPPANVVATLQMMGTSGWRSLASRSAAVTGRWRQICVKKLSTSSTSVVFTFTIDAVGLYYIDDAALTYTAT